jgi:ABC-type phosphate transport system permease subunit
VKLVPLKSTSFRRIFDTRNGGRYAKIFIIAVWLRNDHRNGYSCCRRPTHLYYLVSEASSPQQAYATALILVALLLMTNVTVMLIKGSRGR